MDWSFKTYDELKLNELYHLLELRSQVFIVEQNCVYHDIDGKDPSAIHLLGYLKNKLIAYSRILRPDAIGTKHVKIGRVVTHKKNRGNGVGYTLVKKSIDFCRDNFGNKIIKISAQVHLKNFYTKCGFTERGKTYLEDGIPHCAMYYDSDQKKNLTDPLNRRKGF